MSDRIKLESLSGSNHSIRRPTAYPQTPHILGATFSTLQAGTTLIVPATDFYVYASDIFANGVKHAYQGDKWWKTMVGTEVGWIAEIHKGVRYLSTTLIPDSPAPSLPTLIVEVSDTDGLYVPVTVELKPK